MKKITSVWIFSKAKGLPYEVKVIQGDSVTVFPCENTRITTIKRQMRELFGRCEFTTVEIYEDGNQDPPKTEWNMDEIPF